MRISSMTVLMMLNKNIKITNTPMTKIDKALNTSLFDNMCTEDYECELPYRCCEGLFFNYCCTHDGKGHVAKRNVFPNITIPFPKIPLPLPRPIPLPHPFPLPRPIPFPRPFPQPIPIPIPIPVH